MRRNARTVLFSSMVIVNTNGNSFNMTSRYFKQVGDFLLYNVVYFRIYKFNISEKAVREYSFTPSERLDNTMVSNSNKPFIFPFTKIIGVTQWHGNTALNYLGKRDKQSGFF